MLTTHSLLAFFPNQNCVLNCLSLDDYIYVQLGEHVHNIWNPQKEKRLEEEINQ